MIVGAVMCMLALGVQAKIPWAELEQAVVARENASRYNKPDAITVLPRILQGKPVRINIQMPQDTDSSVDCGAIKREVEQDYNAWFKNAVEAIRSQRREQEFQDILPVLRRGVVTEFHCLRGNPVTPEKDLTILVKKTLEEVQKICGVNTGGCRVRHSDSREPMDIVVTPFSERVSIHRVLIHELGHTLGLADDYDPLFDKYASSRYRSHERAKDNIMTSQENMTADDADGLINIIDAWAVRDIRKKHSRNWESYVSPRILNGWNSLYRNPRTGAAFDYYKMGTSAKILERQ